MFDGRLPTQQTTYFRRLRKAALGVAAALVACALSSQAWADTCVEVDVTRDGLDEAERKAVITLFEDALSENGESVGTAPCSDPWKLHHVRLGESITVVVRGPSGTQKRRVKSIEDLPPMYSQMVRSLLTGGSQANDGSAIDRTNVTETQAARQTRVRADKVWYLNLGYGVGAGDEVRFGPRFGLGHRWELDRFALDLSFLSFQLLESDDDLDVDNGISLELVGLSARYFFAYQANHTPFVALGLGWGTQSLPGGESDSGMNGKASLGYDFFRASTLRMSIQVDAMLPFYKVAESFEADGQEHFVPTFGLTLGGGWGH